MTENTQTFDSLTTGTDGSELSPKTVVTTAQPKFKFPYRMWLSKKALQRRRDGAFGKSAVNRKASV